jgi:hypothetical protein
MLRVVRLRQVMSASVSRKNRAGESAWGTGGLLQVDIVIGILLAHGSDFCLARFIPGAEARRYELAVSTLSATLLFMAYRHYLRLVATAHRARRVGAFPSSLRIPFRAVRIFRWHDGAAIHRGIFPDARNARSGTGTNERGSAQVRPKILAPQYVMPRAMFVVLDD